MQRQWSRAENGEGLSLAISKSDTGEAVGTIVLLLRPAAGTAAIGYWIIAPERGHGYASRAVTLLAAWAVTEGRLARVEAVVEPWNSASRRVLEKAGFQREGLLRSYLAFTTRRADAWMYSLLPSDLGMP